MGAQHFCYVCSYEFMMEGPVIGSRSAKNVDVMSSSEPEMRGVLAIETKPHANRKDPSKPDTLQVKYILMDGTAYDHLGFSHSQEGFFYKKAAAWHLNMRPDLPVPKSVPEAAAIRYPTPTEIQVVREGKYWRVTKVIVPAEAREALSKFDADEFEEISF
jgi:hypothetical protein